MILSTETIYNTFKNIRQDLFIKTIRDLTLIRVSDKHYMVIAVDSDGGIGPQEGDVVQIPAYVSGRFAIRVPLLEILSSGATPICAFDMLTMPMNEIGKEILRGVKDELKAAGLGNDFPVSGSTEDNVPTNMTGIGTTIIGMIHENELRPGSSKEGDLIISVGKAKSGPDDKITLDDIEIISQESMYLLTRTKGVHDILPVGSHGIRYEAEQIATTSGLSVEYNNKLELNIDKSAGPSTCVLASCDEKAYRELKENCSTPVFKIGKLQKKRE
ncbi:MAG: hypothetical protein DRP93_09085 [Candidatus Neomarinimicrobiota bacterium]|nr:MAG: hypothetical protein DRP93_09085 [Candidatus Neomarinimicrobiota bacterium]